MDEEKADIFCEISWMGVFKKYLLTGKLYGAVIWFLNGLLKFMRMRFQTLSKLIFDALIWNLFLPNFGRPRWWLHWQMSFLLFSDSLINGERSDGGRKQLILWNSEKRGSFNWRFSWNTPKSKELAPSLKVSYFLRLCSQRTRRNWIFRLSLLPNQSSYSLRLDATKASVNHNSNRILLNPWNT